MKHREMKTMTFCADRRSRCYTMIHLVALENGQTFTSHVLPKHRDQNMLWNLNSFYYFQYVYIFEQTEPGNYLNPLKVQVMILIQLFFSAEENPWMHQLYTKSTVPLMW